jgi:hypothetical protein
MTANVLKWPNWPWQIRPLLHLPSACQVRMTTPVGYRPVGSEAARWAAGAGHCVLADVPTCSVLHRTDHPKLVVA